MTDLLTILTTQRSGSNHLCSLLSRNGLCHAAEYFYPEGGLPQLADRWGCIDAGVVDLECFGRRLRQEQSSQRGWLGVKLFADHLPYFLNAQAAFADLAKHWLYLIRRDQVAQAVSLHVADVTAAWTTGHMARRSDAVYEYEAIQRRYHKLSRQHETIRAFITSQRLDAIVMYYEDLIADPERELRRVPGMEGQQPLVVVSSYSKQSTPRNAEWAARFAAQFLANEFMEESARQMSLAQRRRPARPLSWTGRVRARVHSMLKI